MRKSATDCRVYGKRQSREAGDKRQLVASIRWEWITERPFTEIMSLRHEY